MKSERFGLAQLKSRLARGDLTCKELVEHYLTNLNKGKHLNAFISVFRERALRKAETIDRRVQDGNAGQLAGAVIALKDTLAVKDEKLTCASHMLDGFVSPYDATVVQRIEEADAIIIGKTNMDEFAMGSSNENSYFGPVKNPFAQNRVAGGSSGGSCVAVAADMCIGALGSDTGGSIRQPASFCGVVGLKPTYGRVSRYGLVAFASSLDQVGPITNSVEDAAILLETICGNDKNDSTSVAQELPNWRDTLRQGVRNLTIGLPKEYFGDGLEPDIRDAIDARVDGMKMAGATFREISLEHTEYAVAAYYVLATAEASSNLARYDGARYGYRSEDVTDLETMYVQSRSQGFGKEVKRRIMLGTYVLSAGYYDAYYRKAQKVRRSIRSDFQAAFESCDCILTPTTPTTAFEIGEKTLDPLTMYLSDIYTVSVNLAGLPAISVPCGMDSKNLPIGLQIIGKHLDEEMILRVGHVVEGLSRVS